MSIKSLNLFFAQIFRCVTLQTILLSAFGLLILVTGSAIAYLSFRNAQEGIDNLAQKLQREVSQRIEQHLDEYLSLPPHVSQLNQQALSLNLLPLEDWQTTARYFWKQLQLYPLSRLEVGTLTGDYIGVERRANNQFQIRTSSRTNPQVLEIWATNSQGEASQRLEKRTSPYGYRLETWYIDGLTAPQTRWSQIEQRPNSQGHYDLWISASSPFLDQQGQLSGVLGVEYNLSQLQKFLAQLKIGDSSPTFIIERNGLLVASPGRVDLTQQKQQKARINAPLAPDPLIRQTAQFLIKKFQGLKNIPEPVTLTTNFKGDRQFIQVTPWRDEWGLDWLIVVVIAESDFIGEIHANMQRTLLLCLLAFALSGLLAGLISRLLTRPLVRLSAASRAVREGNLAQSVPEQGSKEISSLARSFNQMLQEIAQSRQQLEAYSQSLETTVMERTLALQQEMRDRLAAETRYQLIFEQAVEGIYQTDSEGRYLQVNPALAQIYGYDSPAQLQEEQPNLKGQFYVEPQRRQEFCTLLETEDFITNFESQIYRRDRTIIWISEHSRVVRDSQGKMLYYEGFVEDISLRKESEANLQKAKIAAEQANLAKSTFIAHMSHELRSPMNAILGFTRVLLRDRSLNSEQEENLKIVERSGEHLLTLINQILDISKIEAGKITLNPKSFDLLGMLEDLDDVFRLKAKEKGLNLVWELEENLPPYIVTDPLKLRQVLMNLLTNALKFTERGSILLQVRQIAPSSERIKLHFTVTDTGYGIKAEDLKKLLQAFVQTETGLNAQEGTGLGLTISRKFVQLMGGDIHVSSELGVGTTFSFEILATPGSAPSAPESTPQRRVIALAPHQEAYRILIVDDKPLNRQLLSELPQLTYRYSWGF
jgi:PAS domain S-box-containing protein